MPASPPPADPAAPVAPSCQIDFFAGTNCDLVWTSAVAVRREALLAAGGFADFPAGEDTDLWIRLALAHDFAISTAETAVYLRGNGGIMEEQQESMRNAPPPPSPNFGTIAALLADPAHSKRHAALREYGDMLRVRFARQLIYHGHGGAARALLAGVTTRDLRWWMWRGIALLPRFVLRLIARAWNLRHRMLHAG